MNTFSAQTWSLQPLDSRIMWPVAAGSVDEEQVFVSNERGVQVDAGLHWRERGRKEGGKKGIYSNGNIHPLGNDENPPTDDPGNLDADLAFATPADGLAGFTSLSADQPLASMHPQADPQADTQVTEDVSFHALVARYLRVRGIQIHEPINLALEPHPEPLGTRTIAMVGLEAWILSLESSLLDGAVQMPRELRAQGHTAAAQRLGSSMRHPFNTILADRPSLLSVATRQELKRARVSWVVAQFASTSVFGQYLEAYGNTVDFLDVILEKASVKRAEAISQTQLQRLQ